MSRARNARLRPNDFINPIRRNCLRGYNKFHHWNSEAMRFLLPHFRRLH